MACLLLLSASATAETVILRNGFRLIADGYEEVPDGVRLLTSNGGWIAVPLEEVARIEPGRDRQVPDSRNEGAAPQPRERPGLHEEIERIAAEAGLPSDLVRAVAWAESGFRQDAVSPMGAIGLMQLMPDTAAELGVDPSDASENLGGGVRYLKQLLQLFDGDSDQLVKALAAYNAGPGRVAEHGGMPPFRETSAYVGKVLRRYLNSSQTEKREPAGGATLGVPPTIRE